MDATHYWPFAREYSIWNAADVALQFWMADLEPQNLSNAIKWVYTAFFCSMSSQQLRHQKKYYSVTSWPLLMTHLNENLHWKMKVMTVGVKAPISTPIYTEHHIYIMYQWVKICLSDLPHHLHITHLIDTASSALYTTACHSVTAQPQIPVHSMQNNKWCDISPMTPSWMSPVKKKKTSQQFHYMMMFGWMNQYQTGTYASMNIHNHMTCALTLAHTTLISYTSLQNMHQHLSTWTSVTPLTFPMWWQPPAMKIYLIWRMFSNFKYRQ